MEKKRAVELLIQEADKISYLKTLPSSNDEFRLWLKNVENIINKGLETEDKNKYREASQFLSYLRGAHEEDLIQQDYIDEIVRYEIALKSIIQKHEILGIRGEGNKGGEVENKMNKKATMTFLNEKMQEISKLETLSPDNIEFPIWCKEIEIFLYKSFGEDSVEYETFKEAGIIRGIVEDRYTEYRKRIKSRKTALASIIKAHEKLGDEEPLELKDRIELPMQLFDAMQFHSKVIESSRELFKDEHYRDAIYRAFVEVNNFVKNKAKSQLDGRNLMSTVFRLENPIIKLNSLKTQSDKDEQEGFMFLFMGAMEGIRNPKAHENIVQNDPYKALKYLGLASLLIEMVDSWKAK